MKMRTIGRIIAAAAMAVACVLSAASSQDVVNILTIGDSITQGGMVGREEYTYRLPLQELLRENGYAFDFIGTQQHGLNAGFDWPAGFDPDHEGFYGKNTAWVAERLKTHLPLLPPPDIVIIHLGSNDERADDLHEAVVSPLVEIVQMLRDRNSGVKIIVTQIPGRFQNFFMHLHVWWMVKGLTTEESPIVTVPVYWSWEAEDTFDGSHPNPRGQRKLAEAYFAAMQPFLEAQLGEVKE